MKSTGTIQHWIDFASFHSFFFGSNLLLVCLYCSTNRSHLEHKSKNWKEHIFLGRQKCRQPEQTLRKLVSINGIKSTVSQECIISREVFKKSSFFCSAPYGGLMAGCRLCERLPWWVQYLLFDSTLNNEASQKCFVEIRNKSRNFGGFG